MTRAPEAMHGRLSSIHHDGDELFSGIPFQFDAVRYHSLAVSKVPDNLRVTASTEDGVVMGLRHVDRPLWGVQFHPESILSNWGMQIVANFLAMDSLPSKGFTDAWRVDVRRIRANVLPAVAYEALYKSDENSFWLDSNSGDARSTMSIMGSCEGTLSHILTYRAGSRTTVREFADGRREQLDGDILKVVEDEVSRYDCLRQPKDAVTFCLGYVGYLGYGLKADTCAIANPEPSVLPDAKLVFVERSVVFDHRSGDILLLALFSDDESPLNAASLKWLSDTERLLLALAGRETITNPHPVDLPDDQTIEAEFKFHHDRPTYIEKVLACQELILAGESYEICLTNRIEFPKRVDPFETYSLLRRVARVPYGALLRCGDFSVLSASPECFLSIGRDGSVETRPIKGTRPRGLTAAEDELLKQDLIASEKDRAENLMIVDLMRNDLNTVCRQGSVHVPRIFDVESFPSVHQLVSTVQGRLRWGKSSVDCIRAAFPGGSMTGAPKLRTLQILDDIEEAPRGVYSGAIGWLSLDGAADLSIVIRTVVVEHDRATFGVGGAITQLSDPNEEYLETLVKCRTVASALLESAADRTVVGALHGNEN